MKRTFLSLELFAVQVVAIVRPPRIVSSLPRRLHGFAMVGVCLALPWLCCAPVALALSQDPTVPPSEAPESSDEKAMPQTAPPGSVGPAESGSGAKPETAKPPEVPTIKRPMIASGPADKREFDVRPDEDGLIQFQFRNQSWPDVLDWLADVSDMTLDWQELPADYLNIASHRKFTLSETRDMINRHLLARGFTLLEFGSTLLVTKTAGINVSLVPRVDPATLASLPPNRFVRISIPLRSLVASEVLAELKVLISANGSLNALSSTNRLEAMDSAGNLLELLRVLQEEQSADTLDNLAREFELRYVRAAEARDQLAAFLKLSNESIPAPTVETEDVDMMQQAILQQQRRQMIMQQQQDQQPPAQTDRTKSSVLMVANVRRNSLIVHAPPDQMAIIAAFVKRIDAPHGSDNLNVLNTRMKVYRLAALDPKKLVASLLALDALEPTTKLEIDEKNKAIIAYASLSDQLIIQQTIQRLDGSSREFDVIQLRRLRAEDVAGTIRTLLGMEQPKKDNSSRRSYFYFDPWNSNNKKEEREDQLRVGANVQNNQLLIWANEMEREEIHNLLAKLGESAMRPQDRRNSRIIEANRSRDTLEYLKKLQEIWRRDSRNPLLLPNEESFDPREPQGAAQERRDDLPEEVPPKARVPAATDVSVAETGQDTIPPAPIGRTIALTLLEQQDPPSGPAPIRIRFDADGNLILESDDLEALDRLEQLMLDRAPPSRKHVVFKIQHARPGWIKLNLEDYFKEEKKDKERDGRDLFYSYIFDLEPPARDDDSPQLGRRRKLRFISDNDTKSLVVIGADSIQQETIARLIKLWDVPPDEDKKSLRYTNIVKIQYSRADAIAEAIKDAFRDLLSANDKALERPSLDANKEQKREESDGGIGAGGGMTFAFSGRLSLGVDRVTNSIIVSAKGEDLLDLISKLIADLDEAAKPTGTVQSIQLNGANPSAIEKALKSMMRQEQSQANPNLNNPNPTQGQYPGSFNPFGPKANVTPNGTFVPNSPSGDNPP